MGTPCPWPEGTVPAAHVAGPARAVADPTAASGLSSREARPRHRLPAGNRGGSGLGRAARPAAGGADVLGGWPGSSPGVTAQAEGRPHLQASGDTVGSRDASPLGTQPRFPPLSEQTTVRSSKDRPPPSNLVLDRGLHHCSRFPGTHSPPEPPSTAPTLFPSKRPEAAEPRPQAPERLRCAGCGLFAKGTQHQSEGRCLPASAACPGASTPTDPGPRPMAAARVHVGFAWRGHPPNARFSPESMAFLVLGLRSWSSCGHWPGAGRSGREPALAATW